MLELNIKRIEQLYRQKKWTVTQFCEKAKITPSTWYRLRREGKSGKVSEATCISIANALGVPTVEIYNVVEDDYSSAHRKSHVYSLIARYLLIGIVLTLLSLWISSALRVLPLTL